MPARWGRERAGQRGLGLTGVWGRRGAVLAGGALGTAVRLAASDWGEATAGAWPWATLAVNVAGSFVLAVVLTRHLEHARTSLAVALLGAGALGALTTFSTFVVEAWRLGEMGRPGLAAGYVVVSIGAGLAAAVVGVRVGGARA